MIRTLILIFGISFSNVVFSETIQLNIPKYIKELTTVRMLVPTFIDSDIEENSNFPIWRTFANELLNPNGVKDIEFIWMGNGGSSYTSKMFIYALQEANKDLTKKISFIVIGPAISAHAFILCHAKNYKFLPGSSITFHSASRGPKPSLLVRLKYWLFGDINREYLGIGDLEEKLLINESENQCVTAGFLTKEDVNQIENHHKRVILYPENGKFKKVILEDFD